MDETVATGEPVKKGRGDQHQLILGVRSAISIDISAVMGKRSRKQQEEEKRMSQNLRRRQARRTTKKRKGDLMEEGHHPPVLK